MFKGVLVAIVTPLRQGQVDTRALTELVEHQIAQGTDGIVTCGTTGESATLTAVEQDLVLRTTLAVVKRRVPVIQGTGTNSTATTLQATQRAKELGADGALVVTPYYNKPQQHGLTAHFRTIARQGGLPLILYNVPGRTGVHLAASTVEDLSHEPHIVGLKEATADLNLATDLAARVSDRLVLLSGDDMTAYPFWHCGGQGVISVTSNIAPAPMAKLWDLFTAGQYAEAQKLHQHLLKLNQVMFLETNPAPVKACLGLMGRIDPELRSPLASVTADHLQRLETVLKEYQLL